MKLRVPFDSDYVALLGTAVYLFAYYEWIIIYIIEMLDPGFVGTYSRGKPLTSGCVARRFRDAILAASGTRPPDVREALDACAVEFKGLIDRRNALIHAHPITDTDSSQILHYQTSLSRALPDMKWSEAEIKEFLIAVDAAVGRTDRLYTKLRKRT